MSDPTISNYQVIYVAIDNTINGVTIPTFSNNAPGTSLEPLYQQPVIGLNGESLEDVLINPKYH